MQISEAAGGIPEAGAEPCRFPKLEECAHFHYERVQLPPLVVTLQTNMDRSLHSQHTNDNDEEYYMVQVTSGEECWLLQRNIDNFKMLDAQLHQCIYDRKISQLPDLSSQSNYSNDDDVEMALKLYLEKLCCIVNNSLNCGPVLNWLQMDNKGHRLLVPSEESRSINTPAVAAAYSIRRYVSQARDELNLEVGDMISVIDMASPGESIWWRGKRGFQVGFFPQHCVHIIGDKVPRNMPLPPPVVGSLALSPIKPVLRKHGKLIAFFRSFILNRPSRRRLKQSGILKERVFGCDLGEHLLNSGHDIPTVLKCCAEFIEENGIVDGIYRLSGVTSNIQKLRNAFDEDRIPNLYTEEILQDIHSVASLLKMYFRELPNPLCTYQLYQSFVNAVQGCNPSSRNSDTDRERLLKMREAVQKLPPPHYRTLEYLMRHLARVAKHGSRTGMTTRNVAIVWAPNLLRSEELEGGGVAALQGVGVQAVVTEFLICYADLIFCDHLPHLLADGSCVDTTTTTTTTVANADRQQSIPSPKRSRPKSLAISTPTKLITLEEARTKHQIVKGEECGYIEVGGGPKNLPKKYHTVLELPSGRKRHSSGWRSFFSKNRNSPQDSLSKNRKASTPGIVTTEKCGGGGGGGGGGGAETVMAEMKRKLRTVKSAESLTSGISEVPLNNEIIDSLGPLQSLHKPSGHNRSVSHDSYFDTIQNSHNNSEGSLLDLSEIQLNFDLEESEMRIFSEDESLVSSPRIQKDGYHRRYLARTRLDDYTFADSSSPKKQARAVAATATVAALLQSPPESTTSTSRKRTRLEDQLSDIQYIDCSTPDNPLLIVGTAANTSSAAAVVTTVSTTAQIHHHHHHLPSDSYQPKSKSPRNSHDSMSPIGDNGSASGSSSIVSNKRQSLNLETTTTGKREKSEMPKSLTDVNIGRKQTCLAGTPTSPYSPTYRPLNESSAATTPSPSAELYYRTQFDNKQQAQYTSTGGGRASSTGIFGNIENITTNDHDDDDDDFKVIRRRTTDSIYENLLFSPVKPSTSLPKQQSPTYENVLTTISITYKSPTKRFSNSPLTVAAANTASRRTTTAKTDSIHEDVTDSIERAAAVPNEPAAVLPTQEANQPQTDNADRSRPKSLSALEELRSSSSSAAHRLRSSNNLSTSAVCNSRSEALTIGSSTIAKGSAETTTTFDSSVSSSELIHDAAATPLSVSPSDADDDINDVGKGSGTAAYHHFGDENRDDDEDLSLSEILAQSCSSGCGIGDGRADDYSCPATPTQNSLSPNVSPTQPYSSTTTNKTRNTSDSSPMTTDDPRGALGGDRTSTVSTSSTSSSAGNYRRKNGPAQVRMDKRKSSETTDDDDDGDAEKEDAYANNNDDDDENSIYQQVKYLRRSVHEINSLLQMEESTPTPPKQPEDFLLPDFDSLDALGGPHVYENIDCRRQNKHRQQQQQQQQQQQVDDTSIGKEMDTQQHRCIVVVVAENDEGDEDDNTSANACENVDVKSLTNIFEHIDDTRSSSHQHARQSRPLSSSTTTISSSTSPSSPMTNPIVATSSSKETNIADGRASKTVVDVEKIDRTRKNYHEKDLLPPCVRLRNLKHTVKTRSLDECEFSKRCGDRNAADPPSSPPPSSTEWTRRKSFDENLSAGVVVVGAAGCRYTTSKSLNPPKQLPPVGDEATANESAALHLGHLHSKHRHETKAVGGVISDETKLNRERIERYKEERRKELHEKYRSESFKEDKGALLSRLKLKPPRDEIETSAGKKSPAIGGDYGSMTRRTRRRSGDSDESNELSCDSLETADTTITVSAAAAATTTTTAAIVTPTLTTKTKDKRDRQRWQPHERRILVFGCVADDEDGDNDDGNEKMPTEGNNRSNERKKDNGETNTRIVTTAGDRNRQRQYKISTESKSRTGKGTKTSPPSLCIKDMKAIFEPKSQ